MNKIILAITLLVNINISYAQCTADIINAFKNNYNIEEKTVTNETLYSKVCTDRTYRGNLSIGIPIKNIPISLNGGSTDITNACNTKDYSYFETNKTKIMISSFADTQVAKNLIDRCFRSGLNIIGSQSRAGSIILEINYIPPELNEPAKVQYSTILPPNSVDLPSSSFLAKDTEIHTSRVNAYYQRAELQSGQINKELTYVLETDKGSASVVIPGDSIIQMEVSIENATNGTDRTFQCMGKIGKGDRQDLSDDNYNCSDAGVDLGDNCTNLAKQQWCETQYGNAIRVNVLDGTVHKHNLKN